MRVALAEDGALFREGLLMLLKAAGHEVVGCTADGDALVDLLAEQPADVAILLSTDNGLTFPTTLSVATPNDGSHAITVPNTPSTTARVMVVAVGNVFFDVSNVPFTIVAQPLQAAAP